MPKILIVGGGYAGFYTAFKLEKWLRNGEAEVTIVDPLPYMTYQPFLPEVAAGSVEPRHAVVGLRRHLQRTRVLAAKVSSIDHVAKTATITPKHGDPWVESYDIVVVTAGAVSRTFPIPGIADQAIGLKTIEEATAIRDRMTDNFERASTLPAGPERDKLLTVVVVGGGLRRHRDLRRTAQPRVIAAELLSVAHDRRHALPPGRGHGTDHAGGFAEDQLLGSQEPGRARSDRSSQHAADLRH